MIGMVAHESFLYPSLTVRENLIFAARMYNVPQPGRRADELIRSVGLGPHAHSLSARLSQGMRQRLAVVRDLVHEPPILLLDEPLAGLDARAAAWLRGLIADLLGRGRTVCFTTHDPQAVSDLTDRVVRLQSGRLEDIDAMAARAA
jgi:heme exporter protein A